MKPVVIVLAILVGGGIAAAVLYAIFHHGGSSSTPTPAPVQSTTTHSLVSGTYVRGSVTPYSCVRPGECSYECETKYKIVVTDDTLTASTTDMSSSVNCTCSTLTATIGSDGTAKNSAYEFSATSNGITVRGSDGVTMCTASYLESTGSTISRNILSAAATETVAIVVAVLVCAMAAWMAPA